MAGFFDAFEGVTFIYPNGVEHPIWLVEASAENFRLSSPPPTMGLTDFGIFIGVTFGDRVSAQLYDFQESRAVGFLR